MYFSYYWIQSTNLTTLRYIIAMTHFPTKLRPFRASISTLIKEVLTSLAVGKGMRVVEEQDLARSPVSRIEIQMRVAIYQLTIQTILQQLCD